MKFNLSYFFITAFIMVVCVVTTEARIHSQSMDDDNDRGGSVTTRDGRRRRYGYQEQQHQLLSSSPSLKEDEEDNVGHASLSFSDHRRRQQQRQNRNRKLDINDDDMIIAKEGIILTEIMYNPIECLDSQGEWIEFYNNSPFDINISGWTVQDNSSLSTTIDSGVVLRSGRYYVLGRTTGGCNGSLNANQTFDFYLNNNNGGDTITVKDSVGNIIDQIQYNPRNEAAQPGYTMMRHPSVDGNYYPTNTWMQGPYGGNPHGGGYNFVATPPTQGGGDGGIIITEIMYNPIGCNDEYGEWIELYNSGNVDVNIANWIISDAAASNNNNHNNKKQLLSSSSSSLSSSASEGQQQQHTIIIMKPGDYYILGRTQRNCGFVDSDEQFEFALNNDNDIITLQDNYGNIIDSHSYDGSDASPGHSIQRQPDPLTQNPTSNWIEGPLYGTPRSGYYNPFEPPAGPTAPPSQIQQPSSSPTPTPPYYGYNFTRIRHYQSYQLKLYCGSNAGYAIRFSYRLGPDLENYDRPNRYYYDDNLEYNCQQMSRRSYSHRNCFDDGDDDGGNRKTNPYCFDRGHLVMANHLDSSETSIRESNYMTNILPQASGFNQDGGAWYYTEQLIECSRQLPTVVEQHIFGGAMFYDTSNDYFMESHGIPTPEEFWKVVIRHNADGTYEVMSWIFPNTYSTTDDKIQEYITTIDQIKSTIVDDMPELPSTYSEHTSMSTWENSLVGITCDYS